MLLVCRPFWGCLGRLGHNQIDEAKIVAAFFLYNPVVVEVHDGLLTLMVQQFHFQMTISEVQFWDKIRLWARLGEGIIGILEYVFQNLPQTAFPQEPHMALTAWSTCCWREELKRQHQCSSLYLTRNCKTRPCLTCFEIRACLVTCLEILSMRIAIIIFQMEAEHSALNEEVGHMLICKNEASTKRYQNALCLHSVCLVLRAVQGSWRKQW